MYLGKAVKARNDEATVTIQEGLNNGALDRLCPSFALRVMPWTVQFIYLCWEALPLGEWVFCFCSLFHSQPMSLIKDLI